jgi:nitric oxide reductase large subunit
MRESEAAAPDRARLVDMAHLVSLVYPVGLVQPNKRDRRDKPSNGVLMLADYFSILLEQIADQLDRLFGRGSGMDEMRREIFEQGHPGHIGPQQNHGFFCLQCQRNF